MGVVIAIIAVITVLGVINPGDKLYERDYSVDYTYTVQQKEDGDTW